MRARHNPTRFHIRMAARWAAIAAACCLAGPDAVSSLRHPDFAALNRLRRARRFSSGARRRRSTWPGSLAAGGGAYPRRATPVGGSAGLPLTSASATPPPPPPPRPPYVASMQRLLAAECHPSRVVVFSAPSSRGRDAPPARHCRSMFLSFHPAKCYVRGSYLEFCPHCDRTGPACSACESEMVNSKPTSRHSTRTA
jgi:hypothetical protein